MRKTNTVTSDFYCLRCAGKGIPLPRRESLQHEAFHRKKLWCCACKTMVNHIEIRTYDELLEFQENWENGVYANEAEESLRHCEGDI